MSYREYICTNGNSAELDISKLLHIEKAILLSLEYKKLISQQQRVQCEEALEKQRCQKGILHR